MKQTVVFEHPVYNYQMKRLRNASHVYTRSTPLMSKHYKKPSANPTLALRK